MTWLFFCEALLLTQIAYYIGLGAFKFGWFIGWVADPEQAPRILIGGVLSVFYMGRELDRLHADVLEFTTVWHGMTAPPKSA
jgi:hypothetical protein